MEFLNEWKIPKNPINLKQVFDNCKEPPVTRFPPEPSGYLHLGHVKALFINYVIAKKYNGKFIFRFDDTNPNNETQEYEDAIREDVINLVGTPDYSSYSSDYFKELIDCANVLVAKGLAYVDEDDPDTVKNNRENRINGKYRDRPIEENIELWNKMKEGTLPKLPLGMQGTLPKLPLGMQGTLPKLPLGMQGTKTNSILRIKMDMQNNNAALRDPTMYRHIELNHQRSGDKYKVYPTYDFTCPIVDSLEGVTHVFRSCEFADRDEQYLKFLDLAGIQKKPMMFTYGKINFKDALLSKRKIKAAILKGDLSDWDDPRLLTIRGAFNRGLNKEGLIKFIARMGFAKNTIDMDQGLLWGINKKCIDKISTRFCILSHKTEIVRLVGQVPDKKQIPKFSSNKDFGNRDLNFSEYIQLNQSDYNDCEHGETICLLNWGCMKLDKENKTITPKPDADIKLIKHKLLWLTHDNWVMVNITDYKKDQVYTDLCHIVDKEILKLNKGDYVQLMQGGYYKIMDVKKDSVKLMVVPLA